LRRPPPAAAFVEGADLTLCCQVPVLEDHCPVADAAVAVAFWSVSIIVLVFYLKYRKHTDTQTRQHKKNRILIA